MKKILLVLLTVTSLNFYPVVLFSQPNKTSNDGRYQIISVEYDRAFLPPDTLVGKTIEYVEAWKKLNISRLVFKIDTLTGRTWTLTYQTQENGNAYAEWVEVYNSQQK